MLGVGVGIAAGVYAAPAIIGYIGLSGTGALVVTNVTIGSVGNASASFLNALIDDKSAGETAADTGLAFLDGAILGAIGGYVEAGIAKLFVLFKGTTIYKTIGKYFDDIFGVVDDIDSVKTPTGDGNNTITDDVVEEIVEGGSDTINTLTDAQKSRLNSLDNTINDHLTDSDFSGTLRDLQGDPVPNGKGGYFDHAGEMRDSYRSLQKIRDGLEGSLKNPNLSDVDRALLQEGLDKANSYIKRIEELFEPYGGIN